MSFTVEKKTCAAYYPRSPGLTLIDGDELVTVYNKYRNRSQAPAGTTEWNFIFLHGTGMNKEIWNFIISLMYSRAQAEGWYLDTCIAVDAVSHGDSAVANAKKIGPVFIWDDAAKDMLKVIEHEQCSTGDMVATRNKRLVAVGHSFGGFGAVMAGHYAPNLFDCVVPIEAVLYSTEALVKHFERILAKVGQMLQDLFDSLDDFKTYHLMLFYKTMDKRVFNDFLAAECQPITHSDGSITYHTKCSRYAQLGMFLSGRYSIPFGMATLQHYRIPVCMVIGKQATWNPKEATAWVQSQFPEGILLKTVELEGTHVVHGDNPHGIALVLSDLIHDRAKHISSTLLAEQANFDRSRLLEQAVENVLKGDLKPYLTKL